MKLWVSILVPVVILGWLIVGHIEQYNANMLKQKQQRAMRTNMPANVELADAKIGDIVNTYEASGSVDAPLDVKLAPKVTGRITYLQVHEGDRVHKGQVLVRIDSDQVRGQVNQAQANLAEAQYRLAQAQLTQAPNDVSVSTQIREQISGVNSAQADLDQTKKNFEAQVASAQASVTDAQGRVDSAKASVNNAKANIDSAQANLDDSTAKCNRTVTLYKQGYEASQDVDDAKAAVSVQQAAVEVANGQQQSALAALNSAIAQRKEAEQQLKIVQTTGPANIAASLAKLQQAQAALDYAKSNTAQTPAYQQSLEALRATVVAAKAALVSAKAQLADTILIAPMDGAVTGRYMDPGATTTPGTAILAVQFVRSVWGTIAVPEDVFVKLHMGEPTTVRFDSIPGQAFTAKIIQINPAADPTSRQFTIRVLLDNSQNLFKPGMFAHVTLVTDHLQGVLTVPHEAIQQDEDGNSYVMVANTDPTTNATTAQQTPVATGASDANNVAIQSGLTAGQKVVTMSAMPLKDGQAIQSGGRGGKHGKHAGGKPGGDQPGATAPGQAGADTAAPSSAQPAGQAAARTSTGAPTASGTGHHHHHAPAASQQ